MAGCSKIDKETRLQQVEQWLIEGQTTSTICRLTSVWDLDRRSIERYITEAWDRIKEVNAASREQHVARTLKRLDKALYRAIQKEDIKAEAKVIEIQAKILGLFEYTVKHRYEEIPLPTEQLIEMVKEQEPKAWN